MLVAAALAVALGWQVPCAPLRAASECRARSIGLQLPTERTGDTFLAVIDLGEGDGTVTHEFRPYFSSSALITMRYPVPHVLEAEPIQGVIKVTKSGDGLFEGDVRRLLARTAPHRTACAHAAALAPPSARRRPRTLRLALRRCCAPSRRSRCATTQPKRRCAPAKAALARASARAPAPASPQPPGPALTPALATNPALAPP